MSKILRVHNTSNTVQQLFANTDKGIQAKLEKNKISFEVVEKDFCSIQVPPQAIIEVLDGNKTQSELHPSIKGKVIKDVTNQTQFLSGSAEKSALEREIKDLEGKRDAFLNEIKDLEGKRDAFLNEIKDLEGKKVILQDDIEDLEKTAGVGFKK